MRRGGLWIVAALGMVACQVRYVPVREARFRTEVSRGERLRLPLTVPAREKLLRFLRAGGDTDRIGNTLVDPTAGLRYGPLLDRLADPSPLGIEDLTDNHTLRKWLPGRVLRQVIDAREESPPAMSPVAVADGRYWWIFYPRQKRLAELLVTRIGDPNARAAAY
jgi:hypothetical protein